METENTQANTQIQIFENPTQSIALAVCTISCELQLTPDLPTLHCVQRFSSCSRL